MNASESDTPRTDEREQARRDLGLDSELVLASFARTLERELAAALADAKALAEALSEFITEGGEMNWQGLRDAKAKASAVLAAHRAANNLLPTSQPGASSPALEQARVKEEGATMTGGQTQHSVTEIEPDTMHESGLSSDINSDIPYE